MTKMKLCGLTGMGDMEAINMLNPEYVGFVFAPGSRRYISPEKAAELKARLNVGIMPVGVFVNEAPETVAQLQNSGIIELAQLHGSEDEAYIQKLRRLTEKPIIKAFRIKNRQDVMKAEASSADYILLDSGGGTGKVFDWRLIGQLERPYFLAGGLDAGKAAAAIRMLQPYAVDVSSGIETNGLKDISKMMEFVHAVRTA